MGFLEELELEGRISAAEIGQIREAYPALLDDLTRRKTAGERLDSADLIAFQFLAEKFNPCQENASQ